MSAQADTLAHATCEECGDTFIRAPGESWKRLWFAWLHGGMVAGNYEPRYEARAFVKFAQSTNQSANAQRYANEVRKPGTQQNSGARHEVSG